MHLHQLLAILQSAKSKALADKTAVYQTVQKQHLFNGLSRTYQPLEDGGYVYPMEGNNIQESGGQCIQRFIEASKEHIDLCARQDWTNTQASADVILDGVVILKAVPVQHLLYLEKQITDIQTFIKSLPLLDPTKTWEYDSNRGCYVSSPKTTTKTKKNTTFLTVAEATDKHPAQVREVTRDDIEGTWTTVDFSGALPKEEVDQYLKNTQALLQAILIAREEANKKEVIPINTSDKIFETIFRR